MASVNAVGRCIAVALLLAYFAVATKVLAQAGSTGGVVGKTDKSQSGAQPEPKTHRQADVPRNRAISSCSKMPGDWTWFNFPTVVIRPDGTATAGPFSASWTCNNNDDVVMHWSHGATDRLKLSRGGTHLEGSSGSTAVSGDRR